METSPIITLLTDFGTQDGYVGAMKGVILSINPRAQLVDLTHDIAPQDVMAGALALAAAVPYFPPGTVHLAVVDPGVGTQRKPLLMQVKGHYLVGPDNGLLTLAWSPATPDAVYHLTRKQYFLPRISRTFHGRDIFAPAAAHLSRGLSPARLGEPLGGWKRIHIAPPRVDEGTVRGQVIHVDRFGNLITNIRAEDLPPGVGTDELVIKAGGRSITGIKGSYAQVEPGRLLAIVGSGGYLEISVNQGSAAQTMGLGRGAKIEVRPGH